MTLHLLAGKIASGKSTLAGELSQRYGAVVLSEDEWLSALFGDEMSSIQDYVRCSAKLKRAMEPHILNLLASGMSIVLDFPANTVQQRQWMGGIIDHAACDHTLHFLDTPDDECKARLRLRNQDGDPVLQVTDAQFDVITSYFAPPTEQEGFNLVRYVGGEPA